ncbi:glycosyltransferase [Chloroflexia bacterium SDU3-3]|nr:glycosyltransferase [Chloroflexia bacterium SDU3-3]
MIELSVVIPTHNRLGQLKRVLDAFARQTYPLDAVEFIVVSDASTDGTSAFLQGYQGPLRLCPLLQEHGGPAKARNNGIAHASGALILFVDDDVVPTPTLVAEHMRLHQASGGPLVVLGPMLTPDDFAMEPWVRWEQAMLMKQYRAMQEGKWKPTARQFYTGNTSLRRELVVRAGGFDESFRRAEDVELAYRLNELGVEYVFNPSAVGLHYAIRSFRSWMEIPYAYGRNDAIFATTRGQTWIVPKAREEFGERNPLLRLLVRRCLNRPAASGAAIALLQAAASAGNALRLGPVGRFAYSGIFSLRYYQGLIDGLGSEAALFAPAPPAADTSPLTTK